MPERSVDPADSWEEVVMLIEMTHTLRVVHLDGRPHGNILLTTQAPMFEYACHEGNYSLPLILSGARAKEKAAAQAAKTGSK